MQTDEWRINLTGQTVNASWLTPFEPFWLYIDTNVEDPFNMTLALPCSHAPSSLLWLHSDSTSCTFPTNETWQLQHPPMSYMHNKNFQNIKRAPQISTENKERKNCMQEFAFFEKNWMTKPWIGIKKMLGFCPSIIYRST